MITNKTQYQQVKEFMQKFGQDTPSVPCVPSLAVRKLRAALILEEAFETCEAMGLQIIFDLHILLDSVVVKTPNVVEVLDGLCDLDYVGRCGTAIAFGIPEDILKVAQDEVHRSNMSKLWTEQDIANAREKYPDAIVESYGGGLYRLKVDGKTIKSPTYSPANLEQFLA